MKSIVSLISVLLLSACATQPPASVQKCDMEQMRARTQHFQATNPPAAHNSKGMSAP